MVIEMLHILTPDILQVPDALLETSFSLDSGNETWSLKSSTKHQKQIKINSYQGVSM